jgi:hypothetical protein
MYQTVRENNNNEKIENLTRNSIATSLAQSYGLVIQNVSWEDTARFKGSCWGPNISDMTLECNGKNMPVIRRPNLADLTCDISCENFSVSVGNEKGEKGKTISLKEYITNIERYTDCKKDSDREGGLNGNLWLERDEKLLLSSQACILPLKDGQVNFSVKLYNYQSTESEPAVLVILASSQGTSCQVITGRDNLYFNDNGQGYKFKAVRLEDDRKARGMDTKGEMTAEEKARNVLYIYQIPLKVERKSRGGPVCCFSMGSSALCDTGSYSNLENCYFASDSNNETREFCRSTRSRGFDHAMIEKGEHTGKYKGVNGKRLVRDTNYPIRLTLQYYYVSDTCEITENLMKSISTQLEKSYTLGENKGSLVMGKTERVTEPKELPIKTDTKYSFFQLSNVA